jgi:hypothetical protein
LPESCHWIPIPEIGHSTLSTLDSKQPYSKPISAPQKYLPEFVKIQESSSLDDPTRLTQVMPNAETPLDCLATTLFVPFTTATRAWGITTSWCEEHAGEVELSKDALIVLSGDSKI